MMNSEKTGGAAGVIRLLHPECIAAVYALGVFVFYPLCIKNYTQVSQTKLTTFLVFTLICVALAAFSPLTDKPLRGLKNCRSAAVCLYAGATLASTLLSADLRSSLWSYEGYLGGLVLCAACVMGYFLISAFFPAEGLGMLTLMFLPAGAAVAALALLNDFGIDPLGFYGAIDETQTNIFFGTIGNVDYLNAFFCIWLPVLCWQWLRGRQRAHRLLAGICAVPGLAAAIALDPGILALGLGLAVLVCLCAVPLDKRDWQRLCQLAALYFLLQGIIHGLDALYPLRMRERPFALLGAPAVAAVGVGVSLAAAFARRRGGGVKHALLYQRCAAAACCALVLGMLAAANLFGASFGGLDNFFRLDAGWATGRGGIWCDVTALYAGLPLWRKLLGCGPGMLHRMLMAASGLPFAISDTYGAHCEYLEDLLCVGALGLAAVLAMLAAHLVPALRAAQKNSGGSFGWVLAACAYAGQAVFNNRVASVFPLFMLVLALLQVESCGADAPAPRRGTAAMLVAAALLLICVAFMLAGLIFGVMF